MHSNFLLSLAIGLIAADSAIAGLCRPSSSSSAASDISTPSSTASSVTSDISTTSSATSDTLTPSSTPSSTPIISATSSTTSSESVSSSSTVSTTSTTSIAPESTNFHVVAGEGPASGASLQSNGNNGGILFFDPLLSGFSVTTFSIEADTGRVIQANGKYMCAVWGTPGTPATLANCAVQSSATVYVTCEKTSDGKLACTAPAGSCSAIPGTPTVVCSQTGATFNQFFTTYNPSVGYYTYIGPGSYGGYTAIDFGVEAV